MSLVGRQAQGSDTLGQQVLPGKFHILNVGERLVASYLRYIRKCDFIQKNLYTVDAHGEIDVVGINLSEKRVYVCEVAIHLTTWLQYVKDKRPNNVNRLTEKFGRDIAYARKYLPEYSHHFMLWSPIVKDSKGQVLYNQLGHLSQVHQSILKSHGVDLDFVINERFAACIAKLRIHASKSTQELQCPIMRMLQIEGLPRATCLKA